MALLWSHRVYRELYGPRKPWGSPQALRPWFRFPMGPGLRPPPPFPPFLGANVDSWGPSELQKDP